LSGSVILNSFIKELQTNRQVDLNKERRQVTALQKAAVGLVLKIRKRSTMSETEKYMQQFEKELELERPLARPNSSAYLIPLDEGLTMSVNLLPFGFFLLSEFADAPKENEEVLYTEMLSANLFGQGTKGATLGLNERGNLLTISQVVDYNIEYRDFKELIDDFVNMIDFWQSQSHSKAMK